MMPIQLTMILFALLSAVGLLLLAWKLKIFQDPPMAVSILRLAIGDRISAVTGIAFAVFYALVFLIFGGEGGRIHILFGRWIFNLTLSDAVLGVVVMLLVALSMTLFAFNIKLMGLPKSSKSGLGVFGAALALVASFCP